MAPPSVVPDVVSGPLGGSLSETAPTTGSKQAPARPTGSGPSRGGLEGRIIGAALACLARWGVAKTSLDDVAREAGCSRATVYRAFPGGKEALIEAVLRVELGRFFAELRDRLDSADSLEDLIVEGMTTAGRWITGHPALQFVLAHEPELILPRVSFTGMDRLMSAAEVIVGPHIGRWIGPEGVTRVVEWTTRLVISYAASPSPYVDVTDRESVRGLVKTFVLPGIHARGWAGADSPLAVG